jgi:hypothetical protein
MRKVLRLIKPCLKPLAVTMVRLKRKSLSRNSMCERLSIFLRFVPFSRGNKVLSVLMGGNLWVEIDQVSRETSSSEDIAASLEASLSYMTASGIILEVFVGD